MDCGRDGVAGRGCAARGGGGGGRYGGGLDGARRRGAQTAVRVFAGRVRGDPRGRLSRWRRVGRVWLL